MINVNFAQVFLIIAPLALQQFALLAIWLLNKGVINL